MKGFVLSQEGHVVQALAPVSTSGGKTAHAFSMENYQHASIIISRGVQAAQSTSIVVNACSDASGDGATAIPFNVFKAESANVDVLGAKSGRHRGRLSAHGHRRNFLRHRARCRGIAGGIAVRPGGRSERLEC